MNPYTLLNISNKASRDEIKSAYRKKALQYHPDTNKSIGASKMFLQIQEAYAYCINNLFVEPTIEIFNIEKDPQGNITIVLNLINVDTIDFLNLPHTYKIPTEQFIFNLQVTKQEASRMDYILSLAIFKTSVPASTMYYNINLPKPDKVPWYKKLF